MTLTITIPREVIPLDDAHGWPAPLTPLTRLGSKLPEFEEQSAASRAVRMREGIRAVLDAPFGGRW